MLTGPAFVFPGQGSQYPGMARDLTACGPAARDLVGVAEQATGLHLTDLMSHADAKTIADPQVAQLLVFVASSVLLAELRVRGVEPCAVAGHSLGEYTALTACGSLDWLTALAVVAYRGKAMAEAARQREGTMGAVVGLDLAQVENLCAKASGPRPAPPATSGPGSPSGPPAGVDAGRVAVVANVNSARQTVVSGDVDAVLDVLDAAAEAGALRAKRIPVGGAYHSPLMDAAQRQLAEVLHDTHLSRPKLPMVSSVTGEPVSDMDEYRQRLIEQVTSPVRWHDTARGLADLGVTEFVEVGPGRVLAGLGREINRDWTHLGAIEAIRRGPAASRPPGGSAGHGSRQRNGDRRGRGANRSTPDGADLAAAGSAGEGT